MSIRFGFSDELVLVNSALPSGSPVLVDQLRSRKGIVNSPFEIEHMRIWQVPIYPGTFKLNRILSMS